MGNRQYREAGVAHSLLKQKDRLAAVSPKSEHRLMGSSLMFTGDIVEGKAHFDLAIALYDPSEHRVLASRFGQDVAVNILSGRSWAFWVLGYPEAAIADSSAHSSWN